MRTRRIKAPEGEDGLYHCINRIVGGKHLLGPKEKEMFIQLMWQVADFLEIEILDYVIMDSHAHQLPLAPGRVELTNDQLLTKLEKYYGHKSADVRIFKKALSMPSSQLDNLREQYMRRMGNISEFQKSMKQRFTYWYNRRHDRRGTLYMERFKSLLGENSKETREPLAAYMDLNPVRAEIVKDPKDYRFSCYGAAMGGDKRCRQAIMRVTGINNWKKASAAYRIILVKEGSIERFGKRGSISKKLLIKTLNEEGSLPRSELLKLRIRYFTEGLVMGSEEFVERIFEENRNLFGRNRRKGALLMKGFEKSPLRILQNLREEPIC